MIKLRLYKYKKKVLKINHLRTLEFGDESIALVTLTSVKVRKALKLFLIFFQNVFRIKSLLAAKYVNSTLISPSLTTKLCFESDFEMMVARLV